MRIMANDGFSASSSTPRLLAACTLLLAFLILSCGPARDEGGAATAAVPEPSLGPSILLVTIDTLRPDALGWVAGANETPVFDRLAREGVAFPDAVSPVPITLPAHAALLTGRLPRHLGVRDNGDVLGPGAPTLAELLKARGHATGAFVSGFPLEARFGLDRGFDHYDDEMNTAEAWRSERVAQVTAEAARRWIHDAPKPFFAWVHFYDPHDPYAAPGTPALGTAGGPTLREAYDAEVRYTDLHLGELLATAEAAAGENLLTVVTADHGESLGEHGEPTHGLFLYESTIAVPLVFHWPGRLERARHDLPARLVDVAPTLLDLAGAREAPAGTDGVSLRPLLEGEPQLLEPAYVESQRAWRSYGWAPLAALRDGPWKVIEAPRPELYDLAADPGETKNLVEEERRRARELLTRLETFETEAVPTTDQLTDTETVERLRALGYVGTDRHKGEPGTGLTDPKDRLHLWSRLHQAEVHLQHRLPQRALPIFEEILEEEPGNRFALSRAGIAWMELGQSSKAEPLLRRAVEVDPEHTTTRRALARCLGNQRRDEEARDQWLEVVRLDPRDVDAWFQLSLNFRSQGQLEEAVEALVRAQELQPDNAQLFIRSALYRNLREDYEGAAEDLLQAAVLAGEDFDRASSLGLVLLRLGRPEEAREWLERSGPSEADAAEANLELARLQARAGEEEAARQSLRYALGRQPALRARAEASPELAGLLP